MNNETDADSTESAKDQRKRLGYDPAARRAAGSILAAGVLGTAAVLTSARRGLGRDLPPHTPSPTDEDRKTQTPLSESESQDLMSVLNALRKGFEDLRSQQEAFYARQEAHFERLEASLKQFLEQDPQDADSSWKRFLNMLAFLGGATFSAAYELPVQYYTKLGWDRLAEELLANTAPAPSPPDALGTHFKSEDAKSYKRSLRRWKGTALQKLNSGESLMAPYRSPTLPKEIVDEVQRRLETVETQAELEAAFEAVITQYGLSGPYKTE